MENVMVCCKPNTAHHPKWSPYCKAWWWQHHSMGMFLITGTGALVRIKGKVDGVKYRKILEENLLPSARKLKLRRKFIFQHDHYLKHTVKPTLEWPKNKNINVLEWPSQRPDINPIKNLWHDLKIAVHQRSPHNSIELEQFCTEEWENISQSRVCKAGRDLSPQTHSCNYCQRCFHQVLTQEGWTLIQRRYSSFVFFN